MLEEAKHYLEDSQQLEENILQLVNEEGDVKSQFRSLVLQQLGIENTGMVSKLNISKDGFNQEGRWTYKLALTLRPHYVWSNAILNKIKDACIVDKTLVISNLASEKFFADLRRQKLFEYLKNAQPVSLATLDETKFYN